MEHQHNHLKLEERLDIDRKSKRNVTLDLLARLADSKVHKAGSHNGRITEYVRILTRILLDDPQPGYELTLNKVADITCAAKLHDIGKIAIPDCILLKPDGLTKSEFEIVKQHPTIGVHILNTLASQLGDDSLLNVARQIIGSHHEKWNGEGYPTRLKGTEIPLSARIVALADVYDALAHDRPYRRALSHEQTMNMILHESPGHFDPYLLQVLQEHQREFEGCDMPVAH